MTGRVLYVDDEPQLPEQIEEVLEQVGYELIHTADPEEALRIVREEPPALVLAEVLLPDCDGFELIDRISCMRAASPLPVVVLTRGERTPRLYGQALELGVKDFLCKPVLRAQILEAVLAFAITEGEEANTESESATADRSFSGDIAEEPLPELLANLHRTGASGVLTLWRTSEARAVQLRNGSPVEVARHHKVEPIADYLLQTRRIDAEQYEMLIDQLMARVAGPREILLGMEALSEAELAAATHEQARGVLLEMFRWQSGQYSFHADQRLEVADTLELGCNPIEMVLEGVRRSPDEVIRNAIDRRSDVYVSLSAVASGRLVEAGLTPEQRSDAESLIGDCTLAEVLGASALDDRTLYALIVIGALQLDVDPVLMLDQELKPEEPEEFDPIPAADFSGEPFLAPDVPAEDFPTPDAPAAEELSARELPDPDLTAPDLTAVDLPAEEPPKSKRAVRPLPDPGTTESMINEIAERMSSQDDFEIFGIEEATRDSDVRAAYNTLLESLRLERIPRELDELRALAGKLRTRLERAYDRVRSEDLRRAFATLRKKKQTVQKKEEGGSRAVEAESWFRKGETFLARDHFGQAVEAFGMSVHLDPQQGEYAAHLGYALYRSNPRDSVIRREALEHVAKGVKLAPDREKPLLFLGRIFREIGDAAMAEKILRRALRVNPDNPAVVQEMCLLDADDARPKARGLFDRLRGR